MKSGNQLNREKYVKPLTEWVEQTIENRLWEKYADLHIDVLDAQFRKPGRWVEASLSLLSCLRYIVDRNKYKVLLAIPLYPLGSPTQVATLSIDALEKNVDATPPSFYLFPIDSPVFNKTLETASYSPFLSHLLNQEVWFKEEKEEDEYYRGLFVQ
jgi:hypothetical protein